MTHASHDPSALPDPVPDAEPQATGPRNEPSPALAARKSPGKVRWGIAVLLFLLVLINYFDRTNISVTEGAMREEFGLSGGHMGIILSSFLWSYTLMQIPAGLLLDRFGVKRIVRIATWLWALACVLTAMAGGTGLIIIARVVLGFGESPVFPGAMKATGYWFSRAERGVATAIFDSGQRLSNVIGTPLVALVVVAWGWRAAFWATAVLSIVFAVAWWLLYRDPKRAHAEGRLSESELAYIREGGAQDEDQVSPNPLASLVYILGRRKMWGLAIGLACAGYTQWMLLTWLPGYLQSALHLDLASAGFLTAVPWLVAVVVEFIIPGWLVDRLIQRGTSPTLVRKTTLIAGMVIALGVMGAAFTTQMAFAILWITVGTCGVTIAFAVSNSLPALIAPEGSVGAVASTMNFTNALFGISAPIVTGFLYDATGSFSAGFLVCAVILAIGIFFYTVVLGPIEQMPTREEHAQQRLAAA